MNLIIYNEVFELVQKFYDLIEYGKISDLKYRNEQRTFSYNVLDSMYNKDILIQEAGVGTGKTMAYLIPLVFTYVVLKKHGDKAIGFVISTSTIALQEQIKKDLENLIKIINKSRLLKIDQLPVEIAKGYNNYVCIRRANSYINSPEKSKDKSKVVKILNGKDPSKYDKSCYSAISGDTWNKININVQNLNCRSCNCRSECLYKINKNRLAKNMFIVITNHDMLVSSAKRQMSRNGWGIHRPSYLVVDEAHTLEERIIGVYTNEVDMNFIIYGFNEILYWYYLAGELEKIFQHIKTSTIDILSKEKEESLFDEGRYPFILSETIKEKIKEYLRLYEETKKNTNDFVWNEEEKKVLESAKELGEVFRDVLLDFNDRKNIYWISFTSDDKENIKLCYVEKKLSHIAAELFKDDRYGKLFTSATLSTDAGDMDYFRRNLGLTQLEFPAGKINQENSIKSPFDYDNNTILYLSKKTLSPKNSNHNAYLDSITDEIDKLVRISNGRSLILFTSKSDMRDVYSRLKRRKYSFPILIQNENNSDESKKQFKNSIKSCLLSTGFWEGIDVKGEPLEHVIIAKLPFPIVDPIIEAKDKMYRDSDGDKSVYKLSMSIRLAQGAGRLIRGKDDFGIVSILDSRINKPKYKNVIEALPFSNVTHDIGEVKKFFIQRINKKGKESSKVKKIGKRKN